VCFTLDDILSKFALHIITSHDIPFIADSNMLFTELINRWITAVQSVAKCTVDIVNWRPRCYTSQMHCYCSRWFIAYTYTNSTVYVGLINCFRPFDTFLWDSLGLCRTNESDCSDDGGSKHLWKVDTLCNNPEDSCFRTINDVVILEGFNLIEQYLFLMQVQGRKTVPMARSGVRLYSVSGVCEPDHLLQFSGTVWLRQLHLSRKKRHGWALAYD
jgi:hypothetical protein